VCYGEDLGPDWTRFPIAGLHYTKTTGPWARYWRDRNLNTTAANLSIPAHPPSPRPSRHVPVTYTWG
jgi:hypothetical protein